ncbi:hypothetical protein RND71_012980 [Anisodus tanguticus]|uniref:Uncharacterized protein n=1 Tax=Anisodus tanguticus TaxID=243964 RepID=A0AAE1VGK5_9SOLA|nr:hypothetical protein RND71_012980 [Anisodus tanguticus]
MNRELGEFKELEKEKDDYPSQEGSGFNQDRPLKRKSHASVSTAIHGRFGFHHGRDVRVKKKLLNEMIISTSYNDRSFQKIKPDQRRTSKTEYSSPRKSHRTRAKTQTKLYRQQTQSSPSPSKLDETGVHSLLNAKKPIVPGIGTTSPVQTIAGKDLPNPFMAVTLPKSEEEPSSSKTRRKLP